MKKKSIIFICNGNIHRSVIAAACLRSILRDQNLESNYCIDSYGIQGTAGAMPTKHSRLLDYPNEWVAAEPVLNELGIDISGHKAQSISSEVMKGASVIIAMDKKVAFELDNSLMNQFPEYSYKVHLFSELAINALDMSDLAGVSDARRHRTVITNIYNAISQSYRQILEWAK